jgi:hypothetical protein
VFVAGTRTSGTESLIYFARLDTSGAVVWERTGPSGTARSLGAMADGDLVIGGETGSSAWIHRVGPDGAARAGFPRTLSGFSRVRALAGGPVLDAIVVQTSPPGLLWTRLDAAGAPTGPTLPIDADSPHSDRLMRRTRDGGVVVVGSRDGKIILSKINAAGSLEWSRQLGGVSTWERGDGVAETTFGYVVAGTRVGTPTSIYLAGTSATGERLWSRTLDPGSSAQTFGLVDDGTVAVGLVSGLAPLLGGVEAYGGGYLAGIDARGEIRWHGMYGSSVLGGTGNARLLINDGVRLPSGESVVVGTRTMVSGPFIGGAQALVVRLDDAGRAL